jgi:hypothetical protein
MLTASWSLLTSAPRQYLSFTLSRAHVRHGGVVVRHRSAWCTLRAQAPPAPPFLSQFIPYTGPSLKNWRAQGSSMVWAVFQVASCFHCARSGRRLAPHPTAQPSVGALGCAQVQPGGVAYDRREEAFREDQDRARFVQTMPERHASLDSRSQVAASCQWRLHQPVRSIIGSPFTIRSLFAHYPLTIRPLLAWCGQPVWLTILRMKKKRRFRRVGPSLSHLPA